MSCCAYEKQISAAKVPLCPAFLSGWDLYRLLIESSPTVQESRNHSLPSLKTTTARRYIYRSIYLCSITTLRTECKAARILRNDAELRLEQEKNSLYTEIENACLDITGAGT
jgi:hypothetical protein